MSGDLKSGICFTAARGRRTVAGIGAAAALSLFVLAAPASAAVDKGRSAAFMSEAERHLKKGETQAAIIELKNAIQADPGNLAARVLLARVHLRTGNLPAAEKELKAARRRGSKNPEIPVLLGETYLGMGKFDTVLREVKPDAADPKLRGQVLLLRGHAFMALKRLKEAEAAYRQSDKDNPADVRAKVGIVQVLMHQGKPDEAEREADAALARNPKSPEALIIKGALRRRNRDVKGALGYFDRAVSLRPNYLFARLNRAATLIDLKRNTDAMSDLNHVFRVAPSHPTAKYLLALLKVQERDYVGARDALQSAGDRLRDHMPSVFLNGAISFALNQQELAIRHLGRFVNEVPDNHRARRLLAAAYLRNRAPQRAIETLNYFQARGKLDAQALMLLGSANMQLGRYDDGTRYFERAAELAPKASGVRTQLAIGNLIQGESENAVSELEQALLLDPRSRRAAVLLALVHLRKHDYAKALTAAEKLRKLMPDNPLPANLIGAAYLGMGKRDAARKTFEQTLRQNPNYYSARMRLAQIDILEGELDHAEDHYAAILEKRSDHLGALMGLADLARRRNQPDKVVSWLRKAQQQNPKSPAPGLRLVNHYLTQKNARRAAAEARGLNQSIPGNPSVLVTLARAEGANGDHVAAVAAYRELASLKPDSPAVLVDLAMAQLRSKNPAAARKTLQQAVKLDTKSSRARVSLTLFELGQKNYAEARRQAEEIAAKWPKLAQGDLLIGDTLTAQGKHADALAAYSRGLKKQNLAPLAIRRFNARSKVDGHDPAQQELRRWLSKNENRLARHLLASSYMRAGKNRDAQSEFEKLLKTNSKDPIALNNLAWLYFLKRDSRAREYAERAHKQAPNAPAILDTLGWILLNKGQEHQALVHLRRARELAPKHQEIGYHYAVALHRTGDSRSARRELEALLRSGADFPSAKDARDLLKTLRTR